MTEEITGEKLKALRKERKITLEKAAGEIGIALSYLSQIETGVVKNPSFNTMMKILKFYKVKVKITL